MFSSDTSSLVHVQDPRPVEHLLLPCNTGITSPTPPSEVFINATIDYVAWVFNVSNNNVSINVTQENQYDLAVTVQLALAALIDAIEDVRNITEDSTSLEEHIKDISPEVIVTGVRGQPTGIDNPATFIAEPIAGPMSSSHQLVVSASVLALLLVPQL